METKFKYVSNLTQKLDSSFMINILEELINTPSPVGFSEYGNKLLSSYANLFKCNYCIDERDCFYICLPGEKSDKTIQFGAHMDTLGFLVRKVNEDGTLALKQLGGVQNHSLEHEKFYLFTRALECYTGYLLLKHHSVHVYDDARTMPRETENMLFFLDEDVSSADEVASLGIRVGDWLSPEPRFEKMHNGRVRSRFLDNKASVAILISIIKYFFDNRLQPKYNTVFSFPYYEEVNAGGAYVYPGTSEYIALDIGAMSEMNSGTERSVSIVAADKHFNYNRELTTKMIDLAESIKIPYSIEIFPRYSTDAMNAFLSGNNVKHAALGMNVLGTHGVERTFFESIYHTAELCLAYILDLPV